jgi:hypothetical protein
MLDILQPISGDAQPVQERVSGRVCVWCRAHSAQHAGVIGSFWYVVVQRSMKEKKQREATFSYELHHGSRTSMHDGLQHQESILPL